MKVDNTVIEKFHEFKIKKNTGYLVLGFSDDISKIVVLNEGVNKVPQNASAAEKSNPPFAFFDQHHHHTVPGLLLDRKWAEMLDALPDNDVRYAVIDIFYDTAEGARAEIYFISW